MPKNITGSVGRGGRNFPPTDVMTVQYLLNCVPASQGGATPELVVDGAAGPKTMSAIEKFQRANGGFADGRVDPGGNTLRALQARDPFPSQPLPQGGAKGSGDPFGQKSGYGQKSSQQFGNKGFGSPGGKMGGPFGGGGTTVPGSKDAGDPFGGKGGGKGF